RVWQQQLEALGYDRLSFHERGELNQLLRADYQAGDMDSGGGSLHPQKYATGLTRAAAQAGALIHGQTRVTATAQDATGGSVRPALGQHRADQLLIHRNAY